MVKFTKSNGIKRGFAFLCLLSILFQVVSPTAALALTSGPGQPEFSSFEPATTTDMVDLSSGDFTYNIPLLSVPGPNGGYPINLAYHSGIGMEEEASWVGLGWNVNVGAITRQLRGLPDDFNGEKIKHTYKFKPNHTFGLTIPTAKDRYLEAFGLQGPNPTNWTWQLYYNNFKGVGYRTMAEFSKKLSENVSAGLDLTYDSQQGVQANASLSAKTKKDKDDEEGGFLGLNFKGNLHLSSRSGVENFNFSSGITGKSKDKLITGKPIRGADGKINMNAGFEKVAYNKAGAGFGGQSSLTFGIGSSVPQVSLPMKTTSFNLNVRIGNAGLGDAAATTPLFGAFQAQFPKNWEGFSSSTYLENNGLVENPAQGYLYTDDNTSSNALKDFSRDNIPYSKKVPNLPTSSFTHDLYLQTGQGTSSMFRPYFNKVALLSTPAMTNDENGYTANVEVGRSALIPSITVHVGLGFSRTSGENYSGKWVTMGNNDDISTEITAGGTLKPDYEPFYFQVYGDNTGVLPGDDQLTQFGGDEALRATLSKVDDGNWLNRQFMADNSFVSGTSTSGSITTTLGSTNKTRKNRQKRSTFVQGLTNNEAGLQATLYGPQIKYLDKVPGSSTYDDYVAKSFGNGGLMSEYKIVHADGMKYVYGLPSLNKLQVDNVFAFKNTSDADFNTLTKPITIASGAVDVSDTYDEYLSRTENDNPYAHSWMLTSVCANDYIDITNDGPSDDDYGYWVKFNYQKTSDRYKWRVPYADANVSVGLKYSTGFPFGSMDNDEFDNRGSYSYGEKELHYLTSVETKTHIAVFSLSTRSDALSAKDELHGGIPSTLDDDLRCYKLDSIALYSKSSYVAGSSANIPIKVVHFEYSYELC
ncbi:MAG TPA: hypothetical protein VGF30_11055, partial [Bacteroidia bacterium]